MSSLEAESPSFNATTAAMTSPKRSAEREQADLLGARLDLAAIFGEHLRVFADLELRRRRRAATGDADLAREPDAFTRAEGVQADARGSRHQPFLHLRRPHHAGAD